MSIISLKKKKKLNLVKVKNPSIYVTSAIPLYKNGKNKHHKHC